MLFFVSTASLPKALPVCSFNDMSMCGWKQSELDDDFDWTRNSGPTPSSYTGPNSAHDSSQGMFLSEILCNIRKCIKNKAKNKQKQNQTKQKQRQTQNKTKKQNKQKQNKASHSFDKT